MKMIQWPHPLTKDCQNWQFRVSRSRAQHCRACMPILYNLSVWGTVNLKGNSSVDLIVMLFSFSVLACLQERLPPEQTVDIYTMKKALITAVQMTQPDHYQWAISTLSTYLRCLWEHQITYMMLLKYHQVQGNNMEQVRDLLFGVAHEFTRAVIAWVNFKCSCGWSWLRNVLFMFLALNLLFESVWLTWVIRFAIRWMINVRGMNA